MRAVVLPTLAAALLLALAGSFLVGFLQDAQTVVGGLIATWAAYSIGRGLAHWDFPKGYGAALRQVLLGVAAGFLATTLLNAVFLEGPGWPATPWWAFAAGVGWGCYRSHKPVLERVRETPAPEASRLGGVLDRRELGALALLVVPYLFTGFALYQVFAAFSPLIPGAGRGLTIGIALFALHGARLLLAFASHETASAGGFVGWFKENLLRNAIAALVLVAYAVFRADLSRSLPFFPLVEFGLGMAVFAFVLARLRARLKRDRTELASASGARPHAQRVDTLSESDYDSVSRPVAAFIESGRGVGDYIVAVREAARLDPAAEEAVLGHVRDYRQPPEPPALPLAWAVGATAAAGLAIAIAVGVWLDAMGAPFSVVWTIGLGVMGLAVYRMQDAARAHLRPWDGFAYAAGGTGMLLLSFLLLLNEGGVPLLALPGIVWAVVLGIVGLVLGIPAFLAWRQARQLREGTLPPARHARGGLEITQGLQKMRRRAGVAVVSAFILFALVPPLLSWVHEQGFMDRGFLGFYDGFAAGAFWVLVAFGGSALVRFAGWSRARPAVLAREKALRARRLEIHSEAMRRLERV